MPALPRTDADGAALLEYACLSAIHAVDAADANELARLLDAATPAQRASFQATVRTVRELLAGAAGMVQTPPPPELRASILRQLPDGGARQRSWRLRRSAGWLAAVVVAMTALGAGTGYYLARHQQPGQAAERQASAPIVGGGMVSLAYQPGTGIARASFQNLPASPTGHSYQMWHIADSVPHPAGLINDRGGQYTMGNVRPGDRFAITVERDAGAGVPTKKPIVVVSIPG